VQDGNGSEKKPESVTDKPVNQGKLQLMEMKRRQGTTNNLYGKQNQVESIKNNLKKLALF
jgi:hypothetical protein